MSADWRSRRDAELETLAERASDLLVDRTVVHVAAVPHLDECDSPNVLRLTLDDGRVIDIEGGYGGYSGRSCDEVRRAHRHPRGVVVNPTICDCGLTVLPVGVFTEYRMDHTETACVPVAYAVEVGS